MEEKTTCLFCGSSSSRTSFYPEVFFNNKVFVYRECNDCKLNFNYPLLTGDDYTALYPVEYHDEFYFQSGKNFSKQLGILKKYSDIKSFVDYGCGDASLLGFLSGHGFDCIGVEFNPSLVSRLKERYPALHFYTVDEFNVLEKTYDCIHMGDVLEHMTDPNGIVQKLKERLNSDGYLFIEGPLEHNSSIAYWIRKTVFKIRKRAFPHRRVTGQPYHTFLANRHNQLGMLEKNNLSTRFLAIYETGWPFPEKLKSCRSLRSFIEYGIAGFSILVSSVFPALGNRFYYIGQKGRKIKE